MYSFNCDHFFRNFSTETQIKSNQFSNFSSLTTLEFYKDLLKQPNSAAIAFEFNQRKYYSLILIAKQTFH